MAGSPMRISIDENGPNYQVRIGNCSSRATKRLRERLNILPAEEALERMDGYEDLRSDEYFVTSGTGGKEICFTANNGRLILLRDFIDGQDQVSVEKGASLLPSSEKAQQELSRKDDFGDELSHIMAENLPFYRKGAGALIKGVSIRLGVLIVLLVAARLIYLNRTDHYVARSLTSIMNTAKEPYTPQGFISYFINPDFTHRSNLKIRRPLFIRGNKVILEGGYWVEINGIGNLKASIEAHNNEPVTLKVDTREGSMKLTGIFVGEDLVAPKGELIYLGRIPVAGAPPLRVDALDTAGRGAYVRVRDADPMEEATYNWMLGQTISMTARLSDDGDRYLIGEDVFRFAIPKESIKPEIQEIMDLAAAYSERVIVDLRLSGKAWPLRNRKNPREQRRDTLIITDATLHYVTVQSAILKNL